METRKGVTEQLPRDDTHVDIKKQLATFNCPQNWCMTSKIRLELEQFFKRVSPKVAEEYLESDFEGDHALTKRVIFYFLISYYQYLKEEYASALELLLKSIPIIERPEYMLKKYKRAFIHVFYASQAHVSFQLGEYDLLKDIIELIKNECYDSFDESGFLLIQSYFLFELGEEGTTQALKKIRAAMKLNSEERELQFVGGLLLTRLRNMRPSPERPSAMEVLLLKQAHSADPQSPTYGVLLARVYSDLAQTSHTNAERRRYNSLSQNILTRLLERQGLDGRTVARCFHLMMRSPGFCHDDFEAYINRALHKSPVCPTVNYYSGLFYLHSRKMEKGLQCLNIALQTIPYALGQVLYLKHLTKQPYKANEFITETFSNFTDPSDLWNLLCGASEFFLLVKSDIPKAVKYYLKAMEYKSSKDMKYNVTLSRNKNPNYEEVLRNELEAHCSDLLDVEDLQKALYLLPTFPDKKCECSVAFLKKSFY